MPDLLAPVAVQTVGENILLDRTGYLVANAATGGHAASDVGAADADFRHLNLEAADLGNPLCRGNPLHGSEIDWPRAGPTDDDGRGQFAHPLWLVPAR